MADSFCSYTACYKVEAVWEEAVAMQRLRGRRLWQGRDGVGGDCGKAEAAWEKAVARQRQFGGGHCREKLLASWHSGSKQS